MEVGISQSRQLINTVSLDDDCDDHVEQTISVPKMKVWHCVHLTAMIRILRRHKSHLSCSEDW